MVVKIVRHVYFTLKHFKEVELVTFNYGQRHDTEIEVAKIAKEQNLKHHILDMSLLSQLTPNALTQHELKLKIMMMVFLILSYQLEIYCFIFCWRVGLSNSC